MLCAWPQTGATNHLPRPRWEAVTTGRQSRPRGTRYSGATSATGCLSLTPCVRTGATDCETGVRAAPLPVAPPPRDSASGTAPRCQHTRGEVAGEDCTADGTGRQQRLWERGEAPAAAPADGAARPAGAASVSGRRHAPGGDWSGGGVREGDAAMTVGRAWGLPPRVDRCRTVVCSSIRAGGSEGTARLSSQSPFQLTRRRVGLRPPPS